MAFTFSIADSNSIAVRTAPNMAVPMPVAATAAVWNASLRTMFLKPLAPAVAASLIVRRVFWLNVETSFCDRLRLF